MAKEYFEKSAKFNNSDAFLQLGSLYVYGNGVEQNYSKAKYYYELPSQLNNSTAHFYLGNFYSTGDIFNICIPKAIDYYLKSISIERGNKVDIMNENIYISFKSNLYRYISMNNLGLIYLLLQNDEEKANKYLQESAFAEYPFGQNNFGLFNQFYLKNINKAFHYYKRSIEHNFPLAYYNIGYLLEENTNENESIQYYIKASENEDELLIFHEIDHYDRRLDVSKSFILCLTNLKLCKYFFAQKNYQNSKKFFIKVFNKLITKSDNCPIQYNFRFKYQNSSNDAFLHLKIFILNHPLFNLANQLNDKIKLIMKSNKNENEVEKLRFVNNEDKNSRKTNDEKEIVFKNPADLFDFIKSQPNLETIFINEINIIISSMKEILYCYPYSILFGRTVIGKLNQLPDNEENHPNDNINQDFYNGFGID